jgi:hypothetical protein
MKDRTIKRYHWGILAVEGRVNEDEIEGIWLMGFLYTYEIE